MLVVRLLAMPITYECRYFRLIEWALPIYRVIFTRDAITHFKKIMSASVICNTFDKVDWQPGSCCPYTLANTAIDVWLIDVNSNEALLHQFELLLAANELARATKYSQKADRARFITTAATLRVLLGRYLNTAAGHINIARDANNKPYLPAFPQLHFNIAHSGQYILMAFSGSAVGVDLEEVKSLQNFKDVMQDQFSNEESIFVNRSNNPLSSFYKLWTRKEALLKASGNGVLTNFATIPSLDGKHPTLPTLTNNNWWVSSFVVNDEYYAAIASTNYAQANFWIYPSSKKT